MLNRFLVHLAVAMACFALIFLGATLVIEIRDRLPDGYFGIVPHRFVATIADSAVIMAVAYAFGALGAYLRQGYDYLESINPDGENDNLKRQFIEQGLLFRTVVGGCFGMISYLAIDSGLIARLLFELPAETTDISPTFQGVSLVAFFVGMFGSAAYIEARARVRRAMSVNSNNNSKD